MVGSAFVSDATIAEFLNQSISDLYDLLVGAFGDEYFEVQAVLTTTAGVSTVALPSQFYKMTGLFWRESADRRVPVRKYTPVEAQAYETLFGWASQGPVFYRIQAANVRFVPVPTGVHTLDLHFIGAPTRLAQDVDTFDGYGGWEEWVVVDAAMKCIEKEEGDISALALRKQQLTARIKSAANRDHAEPARVQRKRHGRLWWPS